MPNETYTPDQMADAIAEIGQAALQSKSGLQITQNGDFSYTPDSGYDGLSAVSGTVNVSGNPNYVETIEGTIANPWGQYDPIDLEREYSDQNISLILIHSGNWDEYIAHPTFPNSIRTFSCCFGLYGENGAYGSYLSYNSSFVLVNAIEQENTNTRTLVGITPCTLIIIHHPLPSGT